MTSIDPRLEKLVEALSEIVAIAYSSAWHENRLTEMKRKAVEALESSAPLKEFAGMTKLEWMALALLCCAQPDAKKQVAACRQIAESLE